jgi:hypothetical protein
MKLEVKESCHYIRQANRMNRIRKEAAGRNFQAVVAMLAKSTLHEKETGIPLWKCEDCLGCIEDAVVQWTRGPKDESMSRRLKNLSTRAHARFAEGLNHATEQVEPDSEPVRIPRQEVAAAPQPTAPVQIPVVVIFCDGPSTYPMDFTFVKGQGTLREQALRVAATQRMSLGQATDWEQDGESTTTAGGKRTYRLKRVQIKTAEARI